MLYRYIQQILQKFKEKKSLFFLTSRLTTASGCAEPHSQLYDNGISKILGVVLRVTECTVYHQKNKIAHHSGHSAVEKAVRA